MDKVRSARERLSGGAEEALVALGRGFLGDAANAGLRGRVVEGALPMPSFFAQVLRLVYRLIFLMVAEDRGLLHPPGAAAGARRLYDEAYSLGSLRRRALSRAASDDGGDEWERLTIVFKALVRGDPKLGLPALGGLFTAGQTADLDVVRLANRAVLEAVFRLGWIESDGVTEAVDWRAMATEELGSVYESLLELKPRLINDGAGLAFAEGAQAKGNARKRSGSYYTPASLVQLLLDGALDPVLDRVEAEAVDPAAALLGVKVIDPACGAGHFLLAAARRIAARAARARAGGGASAEDRRIALRDVVVACIHGVDRDPMAVDLAKVALWLETADPATPLGVLDANIRCGDALLGVFDLEALRKGIPDAAYKPLTGDDRDAARHFERLNKAEREGRQAPRVSFALPGATNWRLAADLSVAAFLTPKEPNATIPTTASVWRALEGNSVDGSLQARAKELVDAAHAFHWPLEFPEIMASGGFDVVIGNPPWDKVTILDREFFAAHPEVATEANAARRGARVERLLAQRPRLEAERRAAERQGQAVAEFARGSGRFPLTAVGELNLYPLFTELALALRKESGWAGLVLKSLMFTGSTWSALTDGLVTSGALRSVIDFKNWRSLFPGVGYHERFCLACIGPAAPASELSLAVGLTHPRELDRPGRRFSVARSFPRMVNPASGTLPQCESLEDVRILARIAERWPTLGGADWEARVTTGLHMTANADELKDLEQLQRDGFVFAGNWLVRGSMRYAPLIEGKLIHQYDHRFATFQGIARERRFGIKAATRRPSAAQWADLGFEIIPRYWVSEAFARADAGQRGLRADWNIAFRDTTNVISNFRTAIGCVVGPAAFNYKAPNLVVGEGDARSAALFLALFNSTPFDYLLRAKFYGANLTKSLLMQAFVPERRAFGGFEDELVCHVAALTDTSASVAAFVKEAGHERVAGLSARERHARRARIDAVVFHIYGLAPLEAAYVFDTFRIWREKQVAEEGAFITRDLALGFLNELRR